MINENKQSLVDDDIDDDEDDDLEQDSSKETKETDDDKPSKEFKEDELEESDDNEEELRAKKREQRKLSRKRRKEEFRKSQAEIRTLREQVAEQNKVLGDLQKRTTQQQVVSLESDIGKLRSAISWAKTAKANAYAAIGKDEGAPAALIEIDDHIAELTARLNQAEREKYREKQAPRQEMQKVNPRAATLAKAWIERNSWYDPNGDDDDSVIAQAIDDKITAEGFDPSTQEYFDELDERLSKRLPHRYGKIPERKGPPVTGSGRESSVGGYKLSPERVAAMKESGAWDDPARRERVIKEYKKYDKEQKGA